MELHKALRLMRVYNDLNQAELADQLGIGKSYVSELEAGNRMPSMDMLGKYSKRFDVPLSSILFFAEHVDEPKELQKARDFVSSRVLRMLEFIADKAGRE